MNDSPKSSLKRRVAALALILLVNLTLSTRISFAQDDDAPQIEITRAVFGTGRGRGDCTNQIRRIIQDVNAETVISTPGLGMRNRSGRFRDILYIWYRVDGKEARLTIPNGKKVNIYQEILKHAAENAQGTPDESGDTVDSAKKEIVLDAKIERMCAGDSGRLLICHLPELDQLVFVDLVKGEIVHTMRQPDDVCFAAGREHFYIGLPAVSQVQRWSLRNFQREAVAAMDRDDPPRQFVMGCASDGPLGMLGKERLTLWNAQELRRFNFPTDQLMRGPERYDFRVSVSADGTTFCGKTNGISGQPFDVLRVSGDRLLRDKTNGHSYNQAWAMPTANGSFLLCRTESDHAYSRSLRSLPIAEFKDEAILPTADPAYFIALRTGTGESQTVSICTLPEFRRVSEIKNVPPLGRPAIHTLAGRIHQEPKLRYLPDEQLFVSIGEDNKTITMISHQLEEELKRSDQPYLFINSVPSPTLLPGTSFEHQVTSLTSSPPRYELDAGPEGMEVSPTGKITWKTPREGGDFEVVISAFNEEGFTTTFAYNLVVIPDDRVLARDLASGGAGSGRMADNPRDEDRNSTTIAAPLVALRALGEASLVLPAKFKSVRAGGSGRFLIFHIPDRQALLVFDVVRREAVKEIGIPDDAIFAANRNKLLVVLPTDSRLERWDLATLVKEESVPLGPGAPPKLAVMGASSDGPLALWGNEKVQLWDVESMSPISERGERIRADASNRLRMSVSADGQTICGWLHGISGQHFNAMRVHERSTSVIKSPDVHGMNGRWVWPVADGARMLRYGGESYSRDFEIQTLDFATGTVVVPSVDPRFVLKVQRQDKNHSQVSVCTATDLQSVAALLDVEQVFPDSVVMFEGDACELRVRFVPDADAFVYLPITNDRIVIRSLDLDEALSKADEGEVVVTSSPPPVAVVSETYRYPIQTMGNARESVEFTLIAGPDGMSVDREGVLTWKPEARPSGGVAQVVVDISVGDHQVRHEFGIAVERDLERLYAANSDRAAGQHGFVRLNELRMELPGPSKHIAVGLNNRLLVLCDRKLAILAPDGSTIESTIELNKAYKWIGEREDYYVAATDQPSGIDLIDKETFRVEKSLKLPGDVTHLELHPSLPISYVALQKRGELPHYKFVIYNERTGEGRENEEWVGNWIAVSPNGDFLVTGYSDLYRSGSELLLNPTRWHVVPKYGSLNWLIRYKLDRRGEPNFAALKEEVGGSGLGIRLSNDGERVTYLSNTGSPTGTRNLSGWDPTDFSKLPIAYEIKGRGTSRDVAFHPSLPLIATSASGDAVVVDRETGKVRDGILAGDMSEIEGIENLKTMFAPDGRHLILEGKINGIDYLHRYELDLTATERRRLSTTTRDEAESPDGAPARTPSQLRLVDFEAFRGQSREAMTTAAIAEEFSESVVVVRSDEISGSGFVVGRKGYIITCAHCISDEDDIQITFSIADGDSKEVPADVVLIDDDKDIALLRTREELDLNAVLLTVGLEAGRGDELSVIGNPLVGDQVLDDTMTKGIVSSPIREIDGHKYIQVTAEVNPGSSGGPVFNDHGMVIGMVDLKANIEGAGFAIPTDVIARFLFENLEDAPVALAIERAWYDATGAGPLEATYQGVGRGRLRMKNVSNGRSVSFPLESMSVLDQAFVELLLESLTAANDR